MPERLLICTDLDRTLIPNGSQAESPGARRHFAKLVASEKVTLGYVSGRHRALVEAAIEKYELPAPDFVIGDVGTTIYHVGPSHEWRRQTSWEEEIIRDWAGHTSDDLRRLISDLPALRPQEPSKQNRCKLSFYVSPQEDHERLMERVHRRLNQAGVEVRLIWSIDDAAGVGLLDVLPARASKYHAIEALMADQDFDYENTVFCGDSGNDLEVMASRVSSVLVANSRPEVQDMARRLAEEAGHGNLLYIARGGFMGMNGNYSAGILEGIAYFYPETVAWMGCPQSEEASEEA